jgi:cytochrome c oxidase assembly protein subunit 11
MTDKNKDPNQKYHDELVAKNQRVGLYVLGIVAFMIGLSFASVPLYDMFCRITGFGGTTQILAEGAGLPDRIETSRTVKVNFNADTGTNMPWAFEADQRSISVHPGQQALISFTGRNITDEPVTGTAIYNVSPPIAGGYFYKTQCFCFERQTLQPGEEMKFPVTFFIDPDFVDDIDMEDVHTITLSYTFYISDSQELEKAQKDL